MVSQVIGLMGVGVFIFFAVYVLYFGSQVDWFEED